MKRKQGNAILPKPSGRQFETILSINKTRDEDKVILSGAPGLARLILCPGGDENDMKDLIKTQKLTISGAVMAVYIVTMYLTQSFAFGQYQVRIATAIYSAAYLFPFLVVPLGLSNLLSNMIMGGLGVFDIVGGGLVGLATAGACAWLGKHKKPSWLVALPIALIPALVVSVWLSALLGVPYPAMAASLLVGQAICGAVGALLVSALRYVWKEK